MKGRKKNKKEVRKGKRKQKGQEDDWYYCWRRHQIFKQGH